MSENKNQKTNKLEEEVIVMENTEVTVDLEKAEQKAKAVKVAKKAGKIAAIAGIGILGYILGTKASKKSTYDDSEVIDVNYDAE